MCCGVHRAVALRLHCSAPGCCAYNIFRGLSSEWLPWARLQVNTLIPIILTGLLGFTVFLVPSNDIEKRLSASTHTLALLADATKCCIPVMPAAVIVALSSLHATRSAECGKGSKV